MGTSNSPLPLFFSFININNVGSFILMFEIHLLLYFSPKQSLKIWITALKAGIFLRQSVHIVNCFPQWDRLDYNSISRAWGFLLHCAIIKILVNLIDENWFFVAKLKKIFFDCCNSLCFSISILYSIEQVLYKGWQVPELEMGRYGSGL